MFKVGDVVQLKSGGPLMTVSSPSDGGKVFCEWFNRDWESRADKFHPDCLKRCPAGAAVDDAERVLGERQKT
jgi:uncharacterized protein YodC (DUF2158 family)